LTEAIDTTTAGGRLVFHVFGAVAQFERALAAERSAAGVAAARAAGRTPGRPKLPPATVEAVLHARPSRYSASDYRSLPWYFTLQRVSGIGP